MHRAFSALASCAVGITLVTPSAADQLMVNGRARTYEIDLPAAKGPQPTLIMLHGFGGSGAAIAQSTRLGKLAPQQGFVGVFPDGLQQQWNFFLPGKELQGYVENSRPVGGVTDDAAFLKALVADLVGRQIADPRRIYLAGQTNGSLMALRMFCADSSSFAAMAFLGVGMPDVLGADCHPPRPLPILMFKGTADEIFAYTGGTVQAQTQTPYQAWSNDRLVNFLGQVDGVSDPPQTSVLPRKVPNRVEIDQWTKCSGAPLTVYRVIDGKNALPVDLNAGQIVLDFFSNMQWTNPCVAALQPKGPGAGSGTTPGAGPGTGSGMPGASPGNNPNAGTNPGASPGTDPTNPGTTPGAGPGAGSSPSTTANADPGSPGTTPSAGSSPSTTANADPGSPGAGPGSANGPSGSTPDGGNPGTDTADLGPPPPDSSNPGPYTGPNTAGLGPPPPNNGAPPPSAPGGTIASLPPPPISLPPPASASTAPPIRSGSNPISSGTASGTSPAPGSTTTPATPAQHMPPNQPAATTPTASSPVTQGVYGQSCSDAVNGVRTCTDTTGLRCTTTSAAGCDPRTGKDNSVTSAPGPASPPATPAPQKSAQSPAPQKTTPPATGSAASTSSVIAKPSTAGQQAPTSASQPANQPAAPSSSANTPQSPSSGQQASTSASQPANQPAAPSSSTNTLRSPSSGQQASLAAPPSTPGAAHGTGRTMPDNCRQNLNQCSLQIWGRNSFPHRGDQQSATFSNGMTLTCTSNGRDTPRSCTLR